MEYNGLHDLQKMESQSFFSESSVCVRGSSRDIVLLLHSLLNICYSFYFQRDFPGLNIKSFRDFV